jgi:hypothetical protein
MARVAPHAIGTGRETIKQGFAGLPNGRVAVETARGRVGVKFGKGFLLHNAEVIHK